MPSFRDELNNITVSKDDLIIELQKEFDEAVRFSFEQAVSKSYKNIKNIILSKSKSGQYSIVNSKKHIEGYIVIDKNKFTYTKKFSSSQIAYIKALMSDDYDFSQVKQTFLKNQPNVYLSFNKYDHYKLDFTRDLIKEDSKKSILGYYYRYYLTDLAQSFLKALTDRAILDDIYVVFSHIEVGDLKLANGEKTKRYYPSELVVKYSVSY